MIFSAPPVTRVAHAAIEHGQRDDKVEKILPPGRYVLKTKVVAQANVPVLGEMRTTTTTLAWVDVRIQQGEAIGQQKVCQVSLGEVQDVARTIFPESLVQALPQKQIHFSFSPDATFPVKIQVDLGEETMGYTSRSPDGALPTSAQAPELVDVDQDGRPGATLFLELPGLGRYPLGIVSKGHTRLEGWVSAPGIAQGNATLLNFRQRVLSGLPIDGEVRDIKGLPARSHFELKRVEPAVDCARLIADGQAS